jgi:single-strand DNA-binding protein
MPALNKVQLIGNLGRDPETRFTPTGKKVCAFSLAVNGRPGDAEWFHIEAWERLAEVCQEYLTKGKLIFVEGRLQTDKWNDDQGQTHYRTKVVARQMQMLDRKAGEAEVVADGAEAEPAL